MRLFFYILSFVFVPVAVFAQQAFNEGSINYAISIDPPANHEGLVQYKGTYTIVAKGSMVRETLELENGYTATLQYNYKDSTVYSLKKLGNKLYAIQLDLKSLQSRRKKYEGFTLKDLKGTKEIAGTTVNEAIVTYKNGNNVTIAYSKDWTPGQIVFDNYPGIQHMLLSFTNYNDDGTAIRFSATKINAEPVESAVFRIPATYKIISNAEYQQLVGGR